MKLVLYSGGATAANAVLHQAIVDMIGPRRKRSMTYVPFCARGSLPYFERFQRRYRRHGVEDFRYLALDRPWSRDELARAFDADAIYLAGGNTYYFLHHMRRTGILGKLARYAKDGGVLAGLSAGAVIMTPHIELAGYPPFCRDPNRVKLRELDALDLVKFEFFPHYTGSARLDGALARYSRKTPLPVVASRDGGGVVVRDDRLEFIGRTELFLGGQHGPIG